MDGIRSRDTFREIPTASPGFKSGFVGIIGRPNVGKSTLMNQFVGQKIAITSPIAQTTRNRLRGIVTTEAAQIIFVDTPGIHKPHHRLGEVLVNNARVAIRSVDALLFVVDGTVPLGAGDRYIADHLIQHIAIPVILVLNKTDQRSQDWHQSHPSQSIDKGYGDLVIAKNWTSMKVSALTGDGLPTLFASIIDEMSPGPYYYPPDLVTDQPERFIMGELIREQILLLTREEVPHSVAVSVDQVVEEPTITRVLATIYVERDSQKGILIGKQGGMLKEIGSAAREQMQKLIDGKVYLEIFVKVQRRWRQSTHHLAEFGYSAED